MEHVQSWLCISGLNDCILNLFWKSTKVKGSYAKLTIDTLIKVNIYYYLMMMTISCTIITILQIQYYRWNVSLSMLRNES